MEQESFREDAEDATIFHLGAQVAGLCCPAMDPKEAAGFTDYASLAERMGEQTLRRRIHRQGGLWTREVHQGEGIFKLEKYCRIDSVIAGVLKYSGLAGIGRRNYLDVKVSENIVAIPGLPSAFDGFRLLQIADLHCDLDPQIIDVVLRLLKNLPYDAVALTGDYHNRVEAEYDLSLGLMASLCAALHPPAYAILGNHDFLEKVAFLEECGLSLLLNENGFIERSGEKLWICGVDDAHFFKTHDLVRARKAVPADATAILLSHSPEPYREAESLGFSLMLSGHTHGGQICLPGGWPLIRNARVPLKMVAGAWEYGALKGYTSRGTGACGVAARFFCPAEITLHVLHPV